VDQQIAGDLPMSYILCFRGDCYWLIGPFDSRAAAFKWGLAHNRTDHPHWHILELADAGQAPVLVAPTPTAFTPLGEGVAA
jgi:hypothetical protein